MLLGFSSILFSIILLLNFNIKNITSPENGGRLICISSHTRNFSFGTDSQLADMFWLRFLQEIEQYNELKIAKQNLCPDGLSSWHFQLINVAMDLDSKFYEMISIAPLVISITISDSKGASVLFDKAVGFFPNDWRILFQASYQAQLEEKNYKKAADLLFRAGKNGAPKWVFSLAGGLYNQLGQESLAKAIYVYLSENLPDDEVTKRLKDKLENKIKNFYEKESN